MEEAVLVKQKIYVVGETHSNSSDKEFVSKAKELAEIGKLILALEYRRYSPDSKTIFGLGECSTDVYAALATALHYAKLYKGDLNKNRLHQYGVFLIKAMFLGLEEEGVSAIFQSNIKKASGTENAFRINKLLEICRKYESKIDTTTIYGESSFFEDEDVLFFEENYDYFKHFIYTIMMELASYIKKKYTSNEKIHTHDSLDNKVITELYNKLAIEKYELLAINLRSLVYIENLLKIIPVTNKNIVVAVGKRHVEDFRNHFRQHRLNHFLEFRYHDESSNKPDLSGYGAPVLASIGEVLTK